MIIAKTPLRMSFVGGGSDLPSYYEQFGGAVISTAIDKYVYVTVNKKFDSAIRLSYSKTENVKDVGDIEHSIVRAALGLTGIKGGIEITTIADIPSSGTGLGSSSSFTVGLLHALHAFEGRHSSAEQLADESCKIEINICGAPIGKQDQYASAYGGFNLITFNPNGSVEVKPIVCAPKTVNKLQENILMLYTGRTRSANNILSEQSQKCSSSQKTQETMHKMVALTTDFANAMQNNNCDDVGEILHEGWMLKKSLTDGISDTGIDDWYNKGRSAGALGGKILGAGAGGFLMFYAPKERHEAIAHALPNLRVVPVGFEPCGSSIIFYMPN